MMLLLYSLLWKMKQMEHSLTFYEASITLIAKPSKDIVVKGTADNLSHEPHEHRHKNPQQRSANQIQKMYTKKKKKLYSQPSGIYSNCESLVQHFLKSIDLIHHISRLKKKIIRYYQL